MKIGIFIDTFFPMVDGVINVVDNYAKELTKYAEVTVFCPLVKGKLIDDKPYKIVQCSSFSIKRLDYSIPTPNVDFKFLKTLKNYELDLIHVHSPFSVCKKAKKHAKKRGIPLVCTIHSQYELDFEKVFKFKWLKTFATSRVVSFFNSCDEKWTVNEQMRVLYENNYKISAPIKVMPNATNHKPVLNKEKACDKINALFRLDKTTLILLFVGRITFQKNLQLILDALKILSDNKVNFKMLFVGSGQDECRLISKIQSLNLEDKVILCGKITDTTLLQNVYARAKLLLFPSLYDASSLVQIEASCQKTPTVFVDGARTACGIKKDENGFIAKPTARDYANEIMRILADEELYKKVSENCFKDLYLTWEEVVKNVYLEYLRLTNLKNKAT